MSHAAVAQPRVLADVIPQGRLRDVALVVGGALLTAACAQISFPVPGNPVPITGQTFAVMLCGAGLGAVRGGSAMSLYWVLGLIGLPFYADGESGARWPSAPPAATSSASSSPATWSAGSPSASSTATRGRRCRCSRSAS